MELGLRYAIDLPRQGHDAALYLDFRAARRWLLNNARDANVLNLFAYTCGAGVAALAGGAASVTNVDFSESALATGSRTAALNSLDPARFVQAVHMFVLNSPTHPLFSHMSHPVYPICQKLILFCCFFCPRASRE